MATRKDYKDRQGKGKEMKQRAFRLTEEENVMLDMLVKKKGMSLRDLIVYLVEKETNN